jgi:hypothetical protein
MMYLTMFVAGLITGLIIASWYHSLNEAMMKDAADEE